MKVYPFDVDPTNFFRALYWTFIHSFWQAAILLIVALLVTGIVKAMPSFRYQILVSLLFLFVVTLSITFLIELQDKESALGIQPLSDRNLFEKLVKFFAMFFRWLHDRTYFFLTIWTVVLIWKLKAILTEFRLIRSLKRNGNYYLLIGLQKKVCELKKTISLSRDIEVFLSDKITIPTMIGYFRPVIYLPANMPKEFSESQIEAVILHEMAHIKRGDSIINLAQIVFGVLLFFNPFFRFFSTEISEEREKCCDDQVLEFCDRNAYVQSIILSYEKAFHKSKLALSLVTKKMCTVYRVKRIIEGEQKFYNYQKLILLTSCLAVLACSIPLFEQAYKLNQYWVFG